MNTKRDARNRLSKCACAYANCELPLLIQNTVNTNVMQEIDSESMYVNLQKALFVKNDIIEEINNNCYCNCVCLISFKLFG